MNVKREARLMAVSIADLDSATNVEYAAPVTIIPTDYSGMSRGWLLGTLIAHVESIEMYFDLGMEDHAQRSLARAIAAIAAYRAAQL